MNPQELIQKYLDGVATPGEKAELEKLLIESPDAAAAFARASRLDHALDHHHREAGAVTSIQRQMRGASSIRRRKLIGAAAALLLGVTVTLLLRPGEPSGDFAGPRRIDFRDGTAVDLARGARLRVVETSPAKRLELLGGTITVSAAPQDNPLTVRTPHAEVAVLGTRFRLMAARATSLEVTEGKVLLTRHSDRQSIPVKAMEAVTSASLTVRSLPEHRFLELYRDLHDQANGYFSKDGIPYHSVERLIVDGPDYGHLTTSETFSYWIWLEAAYGRITGDWGPLRKAWDTMERAAIPRDQRSNAAYDPAKPATAAAPAKNPEDYPVALEPSIPVGRDPLAQELRAAYGTPDVYAMHWLRDVDDWYGFGGNRFINTYQRGPRESTWEAIPHPSVETFAAGGPNGFLDLFIREPKYVKQWRYTSAPDAELRAIQAVAWAAKGADEKTRAALPLREAAKLGDYARYALQDKHFGNARGLVGWSFSWGGSLDPASVWAWRAGASHAHMGYQNPFAAWALAELPELRPASPNGAADWRASASKQIELFEKLQSVEGAIAGGVDLATGSYDPHPVFHDPLSNEWFGWQAWAMDRVAQYAAVAGDARARKVVDRWAAWIRGVVVLRPDGTYALPGKLEWSGQPGGLHVRASGETQDVGIAGALARAMAFAGDTAFARDLLERVWTRHRDELGVAAPEVRADYARFHDKVPVPAGWSGKMPNGDPIRPGVTFLDLRSRYKSDPDFAKVASPGTSEFRYHRFWAQVEVAVANAELARLLK